MPVHILIATYLLLIIFCTTANAQSESEEDIAIAFSETFVTIATGGEQQLSRAPAVATVITSDDIEEMGALNLDEVLETVPGMHVSSSSIRLSPVYSIRGIHTDTNPHVLMLINGVPITQMWQGDRGYYSTFPIKSIHRIEVIRGPGSAVYGADAFSGVINIITKSAEDMNGTEISGTLGSFHSLKSSIIHSKSFTKADYLFSLEYSKTDGDNQRILDRDAQSFFDDIFSTSASYAPNEMNTNGESLDVHLDINFGNWNAQIWNWKRINMGAGPGLAQALDPEGRGDIDNWLFSISRVDANIIDNTDIETRISYYDINTSSEQKLFPPGTILPIGPDGNIDPTSMQFVLFPEGLIGNPSVYEEHLRFDTHAFYTGFNGQRLRVAVGALNASLSGKEKKNYGPGVITGPVGVVDGTLTDVTNTPYIFVPDKTRTAYYLSAQDEWAFAPDWDLTAGLRYDHYSDFGATYNPRLALVWHPSYKLTTKLLYGEAFRAPSLQELYVQNNPVIHGNEDLDPEQIKTLELAFDYQHTFNLRSALSLFAYEIEDLIEYVSAGASVPTAQNVGERKGKGFEYEVQWLYSDTFKIIGNYAYQNSMDTEDNSEAPNTPKHQFYSRMDWQILQDWHVNLQYNYIGSRTRSEGDSREDIDDYSIVDFVLKRYDFIDALDFTFKINNIFDTNIKEPSPFEVSNFVPDDYPQQGRGYYLTIDYNF